MTVNIEKLVGQSVYPVAVGLAGLAVMPGVPTWLWGLMWGLSCGFWLGWTLRRVTTRRAR